MGNGRIRTDDQIEVFDDRRGVAEGLGLTVHPVAEIDNVELAAAAGNCSRPSPCCSEISRTPGSVSQGMKLDKRDRAQMIGRIAAISLPGDANLEAVDAGQFRTPLRDQVGVSRR